MSSAPDPGVQDPMEIAPNETSLMYSVEPVHQRSLGIKRRDHFQLNFYKEHGYTMVKVIYSSMTQNFQFSGRHQYIQYINDFLMDPDFVSMENIIPQMMGKLSQMIKLSKDNLIPLP